MARIDGRAGSTPEEVGKLLVEMLGDLRAFARFLTKDPVRADDLVQEGIVRGLASAHLFQPGTNFKAWIFTILRNAFYSEGRRNSRYTCLPKLDEVAADADQDGILEMADFKRAFWQLSPDHREILILIGPSGLSYEDAAQVCNCPVGTVKSRASRARRDLLKIIEMEELVVSRRAIAPMADRLETGAIAYPDWLQLQEAAIK